jgi:hypothetical protein
VISIPFNSRVVLWCRNSDAREAFSPRVSQASRKEVGHSDDRISLFKTLSDP